jgi:hypothetical protein
MKKTFSPPFTPTYKGLTGCCGKKGMCRADGELMAMVRTSRCFLSPENFYLACDQEFGIKFSMSEEDYKRISRSVYLECDLMIYYHMSPMLRSEEDMPHFINLFFLSCGRFFETTANSLDLLNRLIEAGLESRSDCVERLKGIRNSIEKELTSGDKSNPALEIDLLDKKMIESPSPELRSWTCGHLTVWDRIQLGRRLAKYRGREYYIYTFDQTCAVFNALGLKIKLLDRDRERYRHLVYFEDTILQNFKCPFPYRYCEVRNFFVSMGFRFDMAKGTVLDDPDDDDGSDDDGGGGATPVRDMSRFPP